MDPDPGGPKTCGSCGSGFLTLERKLQIKKKAYLSVPLGHGVNGNRLAGLLGDNSGLEWERNAKLKPCTEIRNNLI
jgi:hypothetical protein